MAENNPVDINIIELERKSNELTRLLFNLCERMIAENPGNPSQEHLALAASALALQKAISAFLAVEKLCE